MTKTRDLADLGGGFIQAGTGAVQRTVESKLQDVVSVKDFGAVGDGVADDTAAIQAAINAGGIVVFPRGTYLVDTLSATLTTGLTIDLGESTLKHKSNAAGNLLSLIGPSFELRNGVVDCNYQNQTTPDKDAFDLTAVSSVCLNNVRFVNVQHSALTVGEYTAPPELVSVRDCTFTNGVLHDGTLNGIQCIFIRAYPVKNFIADNCVFKQTAAQVAGQSRAPGGIIFGSSSTDGSAKTSVTVSNCYFYQLGHHAGTNITGAVDVYSYRDTVTLSNNTAKSCYMLPFRITNAGAATMVGNTVIQDVDMIVDGSTTYTSSACLTIGHIDRGYAGNQVFNYSYRIENNAVLITGAGVSTPAGIYVFNTSTNASYYPLNSSITGNTVRAASGSAIGILLVDMAYTSVNNNVILASTGIRYNGVNPASISGLSPLLVVQGNTLITSASGIFVRPTGPNLNLVLTNNNLLGVATLPYSARGIASVQVTGNLLPTTPGDVDTLATLLVQGNVDSVSTKPTGYTGATKYIFHGNSKVTDLSN